MNYYKRHIGDYMKDASHLSLLEHGVYMRLLDVYYTREAPIPLDQAARLIGARSKDEKQALTDISNEFFSIRDGLLIHKRCDEEIELMVKKAETNREIGKRGGRPKKETKTVYENNPEITQTVSENNPSHKPITNNQNKLTHTEETRTSKEPTLAARVCMALKKQNITGINPSNPTLLALLNAGATVEEFENTAIMAKVRTMNYVIGAVKGMREQAASENFVKGEFKQVDNSWRSNDTKMLEKAKELGVGTSGLSKFDLIAKIDAKLEKMAAH